MATKPLVLVLGDSHVYWLERFVASAEVDFAPGSFREGRDCRIAFKGYRGGTVTTMEKNRGLDRLLEAELPAVVVLSVAGNAIDTAASMGTLTTLEVGMQLYNFAQVLVQRGVQQVVVCQVVRRKSWRHLTQDVATARVSEINEFLRAACDDEHLSFWRHKGFWNSQKEIFRRDGVHFNARGNFKLWKSIQGSCFGAMKRLQQL